MEKVPRKGEYLIVFSDGTEIRVLKDQLPGSGIEQGESLSRDRIGELDSAYKYARARDAALRLLKVRPRTEVEIRRRLSSLRIDRVIAGRLLAELKADGLVDDRAFARLWIEEKVGRGDTGRIRLERDLEAKGVDRSVVAEELKAGLSDAMELHLAGRLARKKLRRLGSAPWREAREKIYSYLLRRGFPSDTAADASRTAMEQTGRTDDDEI